MSEAALQTALVQTLTAVLSVPIYDDVPNDATYPYVVIDSLLSVDASGLTNQISRTSVYLTVWSEYQGKAEVLGIMAQITAALHDTSPTLSDGVCKGLRVVRSEARRDAVTEGTYTGLMTLDCWLT